MVIIIDFPWIKKLEDDLAFNDVYLEIFSYIGILDIIDKLLDIPLVPINLDYIDDLTDYILKFIPYEKIIKDSLDINKYHDSIIELVNELLSTITHYYYNELYEKIGNKIDNLKVIEWLDSNSVVLKVGDN